MCCTCTRAGTEVAVRDCAAVSWPRTMANTSGIDECLIPANIGASLRPGCFQDIAVTRPFWSMQLPFPRDTNAPSSLQSGSTCILCIRAGVYPGIRGLNPVLARGPPTPSLIFELGRIALQDARRPECEGELARGFGCNNMEVSRIEMQVVLRQHLGETSRFQAVIHSLHSAVLALIIRGPTA